MRVKEIKTHGEFVKYKEKLDVTTISINERECNHKEAMDFKSTIKREISIKVYK